MAGVVKEVRPSVTKFQKGDRVVSDTPNYQLRQARYGGWQKYVVGTLLLALSPVMEISLSLRLNSINIIFHSNCQVFTAMNALEFGESK